MSKAKRIFFVTDVKGFTDRFLLYGLRKKTKGFIRFGHDTQVFDYRSAFLQAGPVMSRKFARKWCKSRIVDRLLVKQIKNYNPDIIHINFPSFLDAETVQLMRKAAPKAFFIGEDGDPWPEFCDGRVETGAQLDLVITTYEGKWLDSYKNTGVRCIFMPNYCDPDMEYRYKVDDKWRSNILFTGQAKKHRRYPTEDIRYQLVTRLANQEGAVLYGCLGRPNIGGINYLYAISGARIGLNTNVVHDVSLYHSNRLTDYLACGTFVLAKRVPDSDLLFKDGVHLRYFDTVEEFFDLANWYLEHEDERLKIANAGMQRAHKEFNCTKIAKYTMDLIENGSYSAPWSSS